MKTIGMVEDGDTDRGDEEDGDVVSWEIGLGVMKNVSLKMTAINFVMLIPIVTHVKIVWKTLENVTKNANLNMVLNPEEP